MGDSVLTFLSGVALLRRIDRKGDGVVLVVRERDTFPGSLGGGCEVGRGTGFGVGISVVALSIIGGALADFVREGEGECRRLSATISSA